MFKYFSFSKSLIGRSHIKNRIVCQDYSCDFNNKDFVFICVCDGCGSKKMSDVGAKAICESLKRYISDNFDKLINDDELKKTINSYVCETIKNISILNNCDVRDLLSTYVFVAGKNDTYLLCRCGDGGIIIIREDNDNDIFVEDKSGYANETIYFNNPKSIDEMDCETFKCDNLKGAFIFTDGVQDLILDGYKINKTVFKAIMINGKSDRDKVIESLSSLLEIIRDKSDDDCSFAIATKYNIEIKSKILKHRILSKRLLRRSKKINRKYLLRKKII